MASSFSPCGTGREGDVGGVSLTQRPQRLPHAERRRSCGASRRAPRRRDLQVPYSFRGGLEADAGFLLAGADGNIFLAVANPTKIEFVGLQQAAAAAEEEGEEEEADLLDFDMI